MPDSVDPNTVMKSSTEPDNLADFLNTAELRNQDFESQKLVPPGCSSCVSLTLFAGFVCSSFLVRVLCESSPAWFALVLGS